LFKLLIINEKNALHFGHSLTESFKRCADWAC